MANLKPTCLTCQHYQIKLHSSESAKGECHRLPPSVYLIDFQRGVTATIWPMPKHGAVCGEHKPGLSMNWKGEGKCPTS